MLESFPFFQLSIQLTICLTYNYDDCYQGTESNQDTLLHIVELVALGCIWLYDWYFMLTTTPQL